MTEIDPTRAMMFAAQALIDRARADEAVAEALLRDPNGVISRLIEGPLPEGVVFSAARGADGEVELSVEMDADQVPRSGFTAGIDLSGGGKD